jgi:diphthamide biosynthesis protein 2
MAAFSASGEDIINRTIDLEIDDTSDLPSSSHEFDAFYELERTADEILKGDFRRVSQFLRLSKTACLTSGLRCR